MNRNETKLLVENWRDFIADPVEFNRKNKSILSSNILIESRNTKKRFIFKGSFETALTEVRLGNMSSDVLLEQVINDFKNEIILNEGMWEDIRDFAQSRAKKVTDTVKIAFEKINQMYENVTLKIWNIITTGKASLILVENAVDSILSKLGELQKANPTMFKLMIYVAMIVVVSSVIMLSTQEAAAEITGVKSLQSDVAMGLLKSFFERIDAFDMQKNEDVFKYIVEFKKAIESEEEITKAELSKFLQKVLNKADSLIRLAKESGEGSYDYQWIKELLKSAKAKVMLNGQSVQ
tara:strand:+ start:748 stop:1626 length:879 start_codon:yes stop_codon:yes gene_type:complete